MVLAMERWQGKVAVVTGASAGIGVAIVEQLVDAGLQVVGLARRKERVEELANKLQGKLGKLYAVKADVSQEGDLIQAFQWIKDNVGPVHILINNAGLGRTTNLVDGDAQKWKEILDTNVLGLSIATREAIRDMRANKIDGHIIHMNSISGHYVPMFPGENMYPASKFAVTALTETLRQELNTIGSKIKITSISPGAVTTDFYYAAGDAADRLPELNDYLDNAPMLKAEDIADAVLYVLGTPPHVQVHELTIRPVGENY